MTPEPSQTPRSQDSGTSSAGRPTGSSIIAMPRRLALALEELVDDDARDPGDRDGREAEQTDEEEFESDQLIHAQQSTR
ncbi:hypothetical protein GCM10009857_00570 [Agromyces soli]